MTRNPITSEDLPTHAIEDVVLGGFNFDLNKIARKAAKGKKSPQKLWGRLAFSCAEYQGLRQNFPNRKEDKREKERTGARLYALAEELIARHPDGVSVNATRMMIIGKVEPSCFSLFKKYPEKFVQKGNNAALTAAMPPEVARQQGLSASGDFFVGATISAGKNRVVTPLATCDAGGLVFLIDTFKGNAEDVADFLKWKNCFAKKEECLAFAAQAAAMLDLPLPPVCRLVEEKPLVA